MPGQRTSLTPRRQEIPTTTLHSGQSTDAYSRPPASKHGDPYLAECEELHNLLTRKREYYGCSDDGPLDNALGVRDQGVEPWIYQVCRIGEKLRRLGGLKRTLDHGAGNTRLEMLNKTRATLRDIAGHAVIAVVLLDLLEGME